MSKLISLISALIFAACSFSAQAQQAACSIYNQSAALLAVCKVSGDADIRLFLNDDAGAPYRHFNRINEALSAQSETLSFAMNAGMYNDDRRPVGLYIENGEEHAPLNTNDGPGNFHMKPNGVFWVSDDDGARRVQVAATDAFEKVSRDDVVYATQSGPMLVIDGEIHPRFLPDSDSLKRRNGVGVSDNGDVYFVLADTPIRFYDFASFFRDTLETPNALYLDGTISRLFAPSLTRNDPGLAMGPIVGVVTVHD